MKLKEIKTGMVIHCKNYAEYKQLEVEMIRLGYGELPCKGMNCKGMNYADLVFYIRNTGTVTWSYLHDAPYCTITEFSDLVLPELTAEETLKWIGENYRNENWISCFGEDCCIDEAVKNLGASGVITKIEQWETDHEKKEPETEWVYRVFGAENHGEKFSQTEDEAISRCEELVKSQKTKQHARYERVCRVKE